MVLAPPAQLHEVPVPELGQVAELPGEGDAQRRARLHAQALHEDVDAAVAGVQEALVPCPEVQLRNHLRLGEVVGDGDDLLVGYLTRHVHVRDRRHGRLPRRRPPESADADLEPALLPSSAVW